MHQYRVDRGLRTNGRERYGYLAQRTHPHPQRQALRVCPQGCAAGECQTGFVPDPGTAPVVQRIYGEYLDGRGCKKIAHGLNATASPPPVSSPRSGPASRSASPEPPAPSGPPGR